MKTVSNLEKSTKQIVNAIVTEAASKLKFNEGTDNIIFIIPFPDSLLW